MVGTDATGCRHGNGEGADLLGLDAVGKGKRSPFDAGSAKG